MKNNKYCYKKTTLNIFPSYIDAPRILYEEVEKYHIIKLVKTLKTHYENRCC